MMEAICKEKIRFRGEEKAEMDYMEELSQMRRRYGY